MTEFVEVIIGAMEQFEARITNAFTDRLIPIYGRLDTIEARLDSIGRRLTSVESTVDEMREELTAGLKTVDVHSAQLFDHQKRIGRLEKRFV